MFDLVIFLFGIAMLGVSLIKGELVASAIFLLGVMFIWCFGDPDDEEDE